MISSINLSDGELFLGDIRLLKPIDKHKLIGRVYNADPGEYIGPLTKVEMEYVHWWLNHNLDEQWNEMVDRDRMWTY